MAGTHGGLAHHRGDVHRRGGLLPSARAHERRFFVSLLSPTWRRVPEILAELLVAAMALFMLVYGEKLVDATWYNTIADFPSLSVGVTYLPIPIGGACLLLFVIERLMLGPPDPLAELAPHAH